MQCVTSDDINEHIIKQAFGEHFAQKIKAVEGLGIT